ncbi:MAG: nucleotidyltransferase domain-containing protein [Prevotella sp.]|nr:nucleotidyltransferase domain-containing protein [Prevotella sp.]
MLAFYCLLLKNNPCFLGRLLESVYFCSKSVLERMTHSQVLDRIKQIAMEILPKGSSLYLYGSRARGDFHEESDWDLLVLLNKPNREKDDWDNYAFPFTNMGWDIGEDISARCFTRDEWQNSPHTMFYYNVEEDKHLLYES